MTKSTKATESDATKSAFTDIQRMMALNPVIGPQSAHFWEAQDRFLKEAERFSSAWFKRRHDATRSALEATKEISNGGMQDPAQSMTTIADWQKHAMERMAEDAKDFTEMVTCCVGTAISKEIEAAEEIAENTKRATTHNAMPV